MVMKGRGHWGLRCEFRIEEMHFESLLCLIQSKLLSFSPRLQPREPLI